MFVELILLSALIFCLAYIIKLRKKLQRLKVEETINLEKLEKKFPHLTKRIKEQMNFWRSIDEEEATKKYVETMSRFLEQMRRGDAETL